MGTNYYLEYKGYDEFNRYNKNLKDTIDVLLDAYIANIKQIISEGSKISQYHKSIEDKLLDYINKFKIQSCWPIEVPDIHICKTSMGWKPLFQSSNNYKSFKEFEDFYRLNIKYFYFKDEYGELVDFNKFKLSVFERAHDESNQSHLQYEGFHDINDTNYNYYKDEDDIEWYNGDFS